METKNFLVYGLEPRNFNRLTEWKPEILSGLQNGKWKYYPVYRMKPRNLTRKQKNYFEDQKKHTKFYNNKIGYPGDPFQEFGAPDKHSNIKIVRVQDKCKFIHKCIYSKYM